MLQILHDKLKGIFASIILFLIIASFALVGLNHLFFSKNTTVAATVDGQNIDWQTVMMFAERIERERGLPTSVQSIEEIRQSLIQTQALVNGLKSAGFQISEQQVAKTLATIPVFQDETGKFSKTKYLKILKDHGYRDAAFRQELAQNLLLSQVEQGILFSNFWLPYEFMQSIQLLMEKRDIGYAVLSKKSFADKVEQDPTDLQAFYDTHKMQYIRPEQVSLQYVELRLNQLMDEVKASNLELKNFYLENQGFYNTPEMRRARHILFSTEGKNQADQAKQLAAAEKVLESLKTGGNFEELAKKFSDDSETREHGGDMGWIGRGDLDITFESALFTLKSPQELSPIVKSADGYHIIQLLEHKLATTQPFEAVKEAVSEQYRRQKAQQLFEEKKEQLAALAFESPESLDKIRQIMNLTVFETAAFDRLGHGAEKWSQYPELLQVAFSPAIITEKRNSEVISLNPERALLVRLKQHSPAEQQPFDSIITQVKADYVQQISAQRLKEAGEKIVEAIQSGESPDQALKPYQASWKTKTNVSRRDQSMDRWIVDKAFMLGRAPLLAEPPKPVVAATPLPSGDYGILSVTKVTLGSPHDADAKTKSMAEKNVVDAWTRAEFGLWAHTLALKANVQLMPMPAAVQQTPDSQ